MNLSGAFDMHKLNVTLWILQNYKAGNPASVLYVKNLAKDVVPEDFYFIFGEISISFLVRRNAFIFSLHKW